MDTRIPASSNSSANGTPPWRNAAVGPATNAPASNRPATNAGPTNNAGAIAKQVGDTLATAGPWKPGDEPKEEVTDQPFREVSPSMQATIIKGVGSLFAQRKVEDGPGVLEKEPAPPVFDPATAHAYDDGSLMPPDGQPGKNVPAPGRGKATPPGLAGGNSVFRYKAGGDPANFQILDQGSTNGCGTTSLAMMLDFLAGGRKAFDREAVDRSIRHYDMFTSPGEAAAFARRRGAEATIHSDTSMADLRGMVDQGLPVQVLLDISEEHNGSGLHYEVVTGYGTGPDGKRYVELANPWGQREYMAEDKFLARWSDLTGAGFPLGINRVAISIKPKGSPAKLLANDEGAFFDTGMTALRVARGLTQVTSGWARRDGATLASGAFRLVVGGLVAIPAMLGHAGRTWSERFMGEGLQDLKGGNVLKGLGKLVGGGLTWAVSTPAQIVGNVANRVVDAGASAIFGISRSIGKLFHH